MNCLTYNHLNADARLLARLSLTEPKIAGFLRSAQIEGGLRECVLLVTCNRFELYFEGCPNAHRETIRRLVKQAAGIERLPWSETHLRRGEASVRHLFRVAAGLQSAMLGENEILGQVKHAYRLACRAGTNGFFANACFHRSFRIGKRVRRETGLAAGAVGYGAAAVARATEDLTSLRGRSLLVVGTGQLAAVVARNLAARQPGGLVIVGRSPARTRRLAQDCGGTAAVWRDLPSLLNRSDAVFSATAAPGFVIEAGILDRASVGKAIFLYDLAQPPDIDPEAAEKGKVVLRGLADLESVATALQARRRNEVPHAERLIEEALAEYRDWLSQLPATAAIGRLQQAAEQIRVELVESASQPQNLDQFSRRLTRRLLDSMINQLKEMGRDQST